MIKLLTNRWIHFLLLFALLLGAVFYSGSQARWRQEMQTLVFDELNRVYPRPATDQITIVNIDDDSLLEIGQWPWPRTVHADLITNLNSMGAKAIVFDGVLAEPDRSSPRRIAQSIKDNEQFSEIFEDIQSLPDHDEIMAEAIKASERFVAGFTWGSYTQKQNNKRPKIKKPILAKKAEKETFIEHSREFQQTANFLPILEKAASGNGSFMAIPDRDGVLRRTAMIFTDGKQLYPALGLEAIRVAGGKPWRSMRIKAADDEKSSLIDTNYRIEFDEYKIPVEADGKIHVYYRKFDERGDDYLSAHKVVNLEYHNQIKHLVKDRIVLIGASAEGLKDLRSTALEPFQPGVEIHANVVEQILQGKYLLRPDITRGAEAVFIFTAGLMMILLAPFISVLVLMVFCAGLICAAFMGSALAYVDYGLLLDPFYASLSVLVIFMASVLLTYLRVESEKRQVRDAFGLYISPAFMQELTENPEKLQLGGENKELTVLFSDIRSFTSISEGLTPQELIHLMNDFLTPMSDLVMQNRGTIDKYMGDAMMAFWNAPLDDEKHAYHACKSALGMDAALKPINENVKKKAEELGKKPVLLNAGIGINTGPCAVGNMGSKQRFAYSTLGDAVNLASRLEGQTKNYGVNILIGKATMQQVPEFAVLEMDLIKVKGKTKPEHIFALLGDEDVVENEDFKNLKKSHDAMIKAYQSGDFKAAEKALKACKKQKLFDLDKVYGLYSDRIKELLKNPPGDKWDGVYTATSK